ncbi:hypothetical protein ACHAW5_006400 [Stephanodiscus triporus]|uniref:Uncharacterized protein n=1 Tax=Stephanodiscus triporus TaxID=2934178 RepID=A0ABD3QTY1_9STRA
MERVDEAPSVAAGYQEPDVDGHCLDEETLHRIIDQDEEVVWLILNREEVFADGEMHAHHWAAANTVGDAVGDSRRLRGLSIQGFHDDDEELEVDEADTWLYDFLRGLARNRSIEHLSIMNYNFSWNPIEIISLLHAQPQPSMHTNRRTNQLERIHLQDNNLEEEQVTRFIKPCSKQRNLREICLKDNEICRSGFWNYPGFFSFLIPEFKS